MANWKKVFVSHSGKDNELVDQFALSLRAIGVDPFLAERVSAAGLSVPKKIAENVRDSNAFVPLLTTNSLSNQWVNQEIGYAYRWKEEQVIDPPYFFPVLEESLKHSVVGFLGIPVIEFIPLKRSDPRDSIHKLLLGLRKYINRNLEVLDQVYLTCPICMQRFSTSIPPQETIEEAIENGEPLERVCGECRHTMTIDPYTLQAAQHVGGRRWR